MHDPRNHGSLHRQCLHAQLGTRLEHAAAIVSHKRALKVGLFQQHVDQVHSHLQHVREKLRPAVTVCDLKAFEGSVLLLLPPKAVRPPHRLPNATHRLL